MVISGFVSRPRIPDIIRLRVGASTTSGVTTGSPHGNGRGNKIWDDVAGYRLGNRNYYSVSALAYTPAYLTQES